MGKLKILQVVETSGAGVGLHVRDLVRGLAGAGHEVHLIYSPVRMDPRFHELVNHSNGFRAVPLNMERLPQPRDLLFIKFIRDYLKRLGPFDIIHGHSSKGGLLARLAGVGFPGKKIYTPHAVFTLNPNLNFMTHGIFATAERGLSYLSDAIISESEEEYKHLLTIGIDTEKLFLVTNGIEFKQLPSRMQVREKIGLENDDIVLGFVGRFVFQKAADIFLQAGAKVIDRLPKRKIKLIIIGGGELDRGLRQMAEDLGIQNNIAWLGEVDSISHMPAFDLFLLTSHYEAMPYVLIEALVAGLAIVSTEVGGTGLTVENGRNGYLVPPGDSEKIAQACLDLLQNRKKLRQFGAASHRKSLSFSLDNMLSDTLKVYYSVLL